MSPGRGWRTRLRPVAIPAGRPFAPAAGFTLVEILVVMVIVGLISSTMLFAFQRVLDARVRLKDFLEGTDAPNVIAGWFRDSADGFVPDAKDGADVFSGAARSMSGLTLAPLNGMAGVPTRVTWDITFDANSGRTYLRYQGGAKPVMTIASWPKDRGDFLYCDSSLACYPTWPPPGAAPPPAPAAPQLPTLIRLDLVRGEDAWVVLATPNNDREPPLPPRKMPTQ